MKFVIIKNSTYNIGSSAKENWELLDNSKPTDIFFHLKSFPSCYVILENSVDTYPSEDLIMEGSILCKNNTKYRNMKNLKVDYTFCGNVVKGDIIGQVYYKSNRKVLNIKLDK